MKQKFIEFPLYCKVLVGQHKGSVHKVLGFNGRRVALECNNADWWYDVNEVEIAPVNFV